MNNKKKLFVGLSLLMGTMAACNSDNGLKDPNTRSSIASSTSSNGPATNVAPQAAPAAKLGNLMNLSTPRGNFNASASGLNPAHGQPGHDCAIAVGAPLDGSSAPVSSPAKVVSTPAVASTPNLTTSNAKLNPAHGQPGHDCAIAVGAPLNGSSSAVSSQTISTSQAPASSTTEIVAPSQVASTPNFDVNLNAGAKLNPAHGQPGHDCAVAVGAPLPI